MWECKAFDDSRLTIWLFKSKIDLGNREHVIVSNKLIKREGGNTFLLFKKNFTFDLFRTEYGRFGQRSDVWQGKITVDELFQRILDLTDDCQPVLPKVTGEALEELRDD